MLHILVYFRVLKHICIFYASRYETMHLSIFAAYIFYLKVFNSWESFLVQAFVTGNICSNIGELGSFICFFYLRGRGVR
jgi:hypothetical protein